MSAVSRWVARRSDGVFLRGGYWEPTIDPVVEVLVLFSDSNPNPDVRLERWDGDKGKRPATAPEIAAYDATVLDAQADSDLNLKAFRALAQATFELKTTAFTQPQFVARIRQIYKNL